MNMELFSKIFSKWTLFVRKMQKIMTEIMAMLKKIFIKCHKRLDYIFAYACMNIKCFDFLTF